MFCRHDTRRTEEPSVEAFINFACSAPTTRLFIKSTRWSPAIAFLLPLPFDPTNSLAAHPVCRLHIKQLSNMQFARSCIVIDAELREILLHVKDLCAAECFTATNVLPELVTKPSLLNTSKLVEQGLPSAQRRLLTVVRCCIHGQLLASNPALCHLIPSERQHAGNRAQAPNEHRDSKYR